MKKKLLALALCGAALGAVPSPAITFGPFGPRGEGGSKNGQTLLIGSGGSVYELEGFLGVGGLDLNGSQVGTCAQLSRDSLPAGLIYNFSSELSSNQADLVLTYAFSNSTSLTLFSNLSFLVLLDAEIDEVSNTFFDEYATVAGTPGADYWDVKQWQIDEPGFQTGTLLRNLLMGSLSNSNAIPSGAANDVAMALGFSRSLLWPGDTLRVQVMISEAGDSLRPFTLAQHDSADATTVISLSGQANPGVLSGIVFNDLNTNGVPDPGEGLTNVVLVLTGTNGAPLAQVATDLGGHYDFGAPPAPGTYTVNVNPATLPAGFTNNTSHPIPGSAYSATRTLGVTSEVLNWGYTAPSQQFMDVTALLPMGFIQWQLDRATGSLLGTLSISNSLPGSASYGPPFQLGLHPAASLYYPHPAGTLSDGLSYVDLSGAAMARVAGGVIRPGQRLVLTNAVEIYSLTRTPPPNSQFELWATRQ